MIKIINVVGARPNFMKIAPIVEEMEKHSEIESILVHTGQHYDENMSKLFFKDLGIPKPQVYLGVGSGSHAKQTARIMLEFEKVLLREKPDVVIVVGDVNSTIACALTSVKLYIPVAHIEAGLRSFDATMPEEINRILTDAISDYLFTTEESAKTNLIREGKPEEKIYFVGNVMADTLLKNKKRAGKSNILLALNLKPKTYAVLTLHRPSNVDDKDTLQRILEALRSISKEIPIIFPIHPRTKRQIENFGFHDYFLFHNLNSTNPIDSKNPIHCIAPLGYLDFLHLIANSNFVLTDSGGIQEETTILTIPCITLRKNTERPITVEEGTNVIVGSDKKKIISESFKIIKGDKRESKIPKFWDGKASQRIIKILLKNYRKIS